MEQEIKELKDRIYELEEKIRLMEERREKRIQERKKIGNTKIRLVDTINDMDVYEISINSGYLMIEKVGDN